MAVLLFLLTLSLLVFVHEAGHFIAARRSGVQVEEFGFGLPPRIFGRKIGQTLYSLNLLPIGGFVRLKGESSGEVLGFGEPGSFSGAGRKRRALIIISGVIGNLLLSYLLYLLLFVIGNPRLSGKVIVDEVSSSSPAAVAGLNKGDVVKEVNGEAVEEIGKLVSVTNKERGREVRLKILRGGSLIAVKATPRLNPPSGEGPLGIKLNFKGEIAYDRYPIYLAPFYAGREVWRGLGMMANGLTSALRSLFAVKVPQGVTGVVGIYKLTADASSLGLRVFLQFVSLLSLNLFVFNLLPFPALDGGRLIFVFLEKILGRRVSPKIENAVNNLGLALLLTIFVLITASDIKRFFL